MLRPASYLATLRAAEGTLLQLEDARSVLIAVAPIVGVPRVISAARNLAEAIGFELDIERGSGRGGLSPTTSDAPGRWAGGVGAFGGRHAWVSPGLREALANGRGPFRTLTPTPRSR